MKANQRFRGVLCFLAGVAVTLAVMFGLLYGQDARAASSCIRKNLDAYQSNGDIPEAQFNVLYKVPSCFAENGYKAVNAWMRGDDVAVTYKKN